MRFEIWHNPRCSKSRAALAILEQAGAELEIRRYLDDPPGEEALDRTLAALGLEPHELARLEEPVARELGLRDRNMSRPEWLRTLRDHPILIERPVVIAEDGRAVVGRPPEKVRDLLVTRTPS